MHIGFWCLVFLWSILSVEDSYLSTQHLANRNWLSTSCLLIIFYINYFILIDIFFFKKKKIIFYVLNLFLIIAVYFTIRYSFTLNTFNLTLHGVRMRQVRDVSMPSTQLVLSMILSIGMCVGLKINTKWTKNKLLLQNVKQKQLDSEIKYLRYQIQPHFLFNTLNNIYSLIDSSPTIAKDSIHSLSKMMRYLLHESTANKVSLTKEIDFLERYIDLMQMRVSSNLTIEKNFPIINQPIQLPPLLLISFIENAFKHGIDAIQTSFIKIKLTIEKDEIHYIVSNSYFPQFSKETNSGIGLDNLKKRLELLYPNKFELIQEEKDKVYTSKLILNFKNDD